MKGAQACNAVASKVRRVCARLLCLARSEVEDGVLALALAAGQLQFVEGRVDTTSVPGRRACLTLLGCIDWAAHILRSPTAPRRYREEFTINYRALFPNLSARHYRVDIFEAAMQWSSTRWVNGERFDLSEEALHAAEGLQCAWAALGAWLSAWCEGCKPPVSGPARVELQEALAAFDAAWAAFEWRYVTELIHIEASARGLVTSAAAEEQLLQQLEARFRACAGGGEGEEELREQRRRLLQCVARVNSAANLRWKGREDRGAEVLEASLRTLRAAENLDARTERGERRVTQVLCAGVVEAFESVRQYLREVPNWIDSVHPHLCNNAGLVARMSAWTDSWELQARYMEPAPLLASVCSLVGAIHSARRLVPALASMCDECDVELFLVLPRLVWLCFLAEPAEHAALMQRLVPHHIDEQKDPPTVGAELERFAASFREVSRLLVGAPGAGGPNRAQGVDDYNEAAAKQQAWEVLIMRVVAGPGGTGVGCCAPPSCPDCPRPGSPCGGAVVLSVEVEPAVEAFVHQLERWSMELQRHRPEDWCQCSAVLVRCLAGEAAPGLPGPGDGGKVPFCV